MSYTPEEIKTLIAAPMNVGMAVAMVDIGIVSTAVEAAAMTKEVVCAAKKYPNNSIIQAAFSEEALKSTKLDKPDVKPEEVESGAYIDKTFAELAQALQVVEGRATTEEVAEFKQFIYDCGDAVANAAGSGLFGSGAKVSEKEAAVLTRLKATLGL
jgi:hypothetical protein